MGPSPQIQVWDEGKVAREHNTRKMFSWGSDKIVLLCRVGMGLETYYMSLEIAQLLRRLGYCQGVAYSQDGQWIAGYNRYLGFCSVFDVELWGILDGLVFIQREGHKRVLIHTDNLEAVKALQDIHSTEANSALVKRIHMTLQTIEQ
ncbi:hypothetical protein Goarm_011538 [Gossypium armourianum]|uniref:RNase H type-1 domain-containing protein n=1 Tax=Gossypium armourianum TaxID=34283 RepID=A0A7J9IXW8_9ROSI|nr:hypothetical protein [Gossypium armourianum]